MNHLNNNSSDKFYHFKKEFNINDGKNQDNGNVQNERQEKSERNNQDQGHGLGQGHVHGHNRHGQQMKKEESYKVLSDRQEKQPTVSNSTKSVNNNNNGIKKTFINQPKDDEK